MGRRRPERLQPESLLTERRRRSRTPERRLTGPKEVKKQEIQALENARIEILSEIGAALQVHATELDQDAIREATNEAMRQLARSERELRRVERERESQRQSVNEERRRIIENARREAMAANEAARRSLRDHSRTQGNNGARTTAHIETENGSIIIDLPESDTETLWVIDHDRIGPVAPEPQPAMPTHQPRSQPTPPTPPMPGHNAEAPPEN